MSLKALVAAGTKVWSDSVEPGVIKAAPGKGITGATSNPIIIADILKGRGGGGFDGQISELIAQGLSDSDIAWWLDDYLVKEAQKAFMGVWEKTRGNDGYVSFELDPLLEDASKPIPQEQAVKRYIELGRKWSAGHKNRMIKIPATAAGLASLETLASEGLTINVTLCFSERQYKIARDAIWRGAQKRKAGQGRLEHFKSVYSIFVSRVDVYTQKHCPDLTQAPQGGQGLVGIVNAKRMWQMNQEFWRDKKLPLQQEIIFASTGKKLDWQSEDYYVEALAGSDIQTNPPATNDWVDSHDKVYTRQVNQLPGRGVLDEIDKKVDVADMEKVLMEEGTKKFADPQKALEQQIGQKRKLLVGGAGGAGAK